MQQMQLEKRLSTSTCDFVLGRFFSEGFFRFLNILGAVMYTI